MFFTGDSKLGLRFKSRTSQIGLNVTNGSPPVQHFFNRRGVASDAKTRRWARQFRCTLRHLTANTNTEDLIFDLICSSVTKLTLNFSSSASPSPDASAHASSSSLAVCSQVVNSLLAECSSSSIPSSRDLISEKTAHYKTEHRSGLIWPKCLVISSKKNLL